VVPAEKIKEVLIKLDVNSEHCTLDIMIEDAQRLANSRGLCLAGATLETFGIKIEDIFAFQRELDSALEAIENEEDVGELQEHSKNLNNVLNDITRGVDEKAVKILIKELLNIAKEILKKQGTKLGSALASWIPFIGKVVDIACNALDMYQSANSDFDKFTGIDKWRYINVGLGVYTAETRDVNQERWEKKYNRHYENDTDRYHGKREATRMANEDIIEDLQDTAAGATTNAGGICWNFKQAYETKAVKYTKNFGELWDPERVEVEIPLMMGEPYPEII
jgi:hypothetical protein